MFFKAARAALLIPLAGLAMACAAKPDPTVWEDYARAKIVYSRGQMTQAVDSLGKLVSRAGGFAPARLLYGRALYFQRDYNRAHEVLGSLVKDHPESVEAALWLIRTELEQSQTAEAEGRLARLLEVNPDDSRLAYQMALIRENRNDLVGAKDFLTSAATTDEDLALIHYEAARVGYQLHDMPQAKAELVLALAILPERSLLRKPLERLQKDLNSPAHKE